jgi:hypothetical protein
MTDPADRATGTEDLERGMRASPSSEFAVILPIVLAMLLIFNSAGLVRWTQQLPSGPASAWLAERASDFDRVMQQGPGLLLQKARALVRIETR